MRSLLILLLWCPLAFADDMIVCDRNNLSVPGAVLDAPRSAPAESYLSNPDAMIWSDPLSHSPRPWDGVRPLGSTRYWKCVNTDTDADFDDVIEMSQAEKTLLDQANQQAQTLTIREAGRQIVDTLSEQGVVLRAVVKLMVQEINTLRAQHGLPPRTEAQVKTALKNAIQSGDVD